MAGPMAHLRYLNYLLRHKYFVFVEACRLGIPVRGIMHDLSKFRPSEWFPYVEAFYGGRSGDTDQMAKFDRAWLLHQSRNDHHWQYWHLIFDDGGDKWMMMSEGANKEMMADWIGAGRALGFNGPDDTLIWYTSHREIITLHPQTELWIQEKLGLSQNGLKPR